MQETRTWYIVDHYKPTQLVGIQGTYDGCFVRPVQGSAESKGYMVGNDAFRTKDEAKTWAFDQLKKAIASYEEDVRGVPTYRVFF